MTRIERIVVLRLSAIGDIVLTSALLRLLRKRFPEATIDFVVKAEFADLLRHNPHVNSLHLVVPEAGLAGLRQLGQELRRSRYDLAIDLHKNFRTIYLTRHCAASHVLRYRKYLWRRWLFVQFKMNTLRTAPPVSRRYLQTASPLGLVDDGEGLELWWQPEHEAEAEDALLQAGWRHNQPILSLAPGAGYATKRWPVEYFAELAARLLQNRPDMTVAILGGPQDAPLGRQITARAGNRVLDLTGGCSLLASAAVVKRSRVLVTNDTGLMHIAEAVRTPTIVLAGSTTRELGFFPQLETSCVLENERLSCRPCSHLGYRTCPRGHFRCMREITPQQVLAEVQTRLDEDRYSDRL